MRQRIAVSEAELLVRIATILILVTASSASPVNAHQEDDASANASQKSRSKHSHKHTKKSEGDQTFNPWALLEFAISPAHASNQSTTIKIENNFRIIRSNGLPNHTTGAFPNSGNPNTISEQHYEFRVPVVPQTAGTTIPLRMNLFGVALNGIPFDPGAAEWWMGNPSSGWQYEAMALGPRLGLDSNNAHVQPNGAYHYHGPPTGLLKILSSLNGPVLLGYAADGYPIYSPKGYSNPIDSKSSMRELKSSYRVRFGLRPNGPRGSYDGLFVQDYEFVQGLGDLDDSNGRTGVTPEYPEGTYYYVLTNGYPYIPRSFKGVPDSSFAKHGPGGRGGPRHMPPPPPSW